MTTKHVLWQPTLRAVINYILPYNDALANEYFILFDNLFRQTIDIPRLIRSIDRMIHSSPLTVVELTIKLLTANFNNVAILLSVQYLLLNTDSSQMTLIQRKRMNEVIVKIHHAAMNFILTSNLINYTQLVACPSRSLIHIECAL